MLLKAKDNTTIIKTNSQNLNIVPQFCQTCQKEKNKIYTYHSSFCSEDCFNIASRKHCGGAILPLQMYKGEPCFILIKDGTRNENISELAGGKKQLHEGSGKTSAREGTEELGLKKTISYHYLENNGVRLLTWFNKNQYENEFNSEDMINNNDYINYTVYIIAIENFDVEEANLAAQSRKDDNIILKEWKETESIFLVPIKHLENYAQGKNNCIYDYKGYQIPTLSSRWKDFLIDKNTIKIMKQLIFSKVEPWRVKIRNQSKHESFVWTHKDLENK
jgi:hypothetical protein